MKLLVGVTGGIAAYKAAELVSTALKAGHDVRVMMTENGERFVGSATFEGLTGHPVLTHTFADAMAHITWAKWADCVVLAPLTANTMTKLAMGLADDALSTVLMAIPAGTPVVLAPAMNTEMWQHPATVRNRGWLEAMERYTFVAPISKRLACGDVGTGGLAEIEDILTEVTRRTADRP
jgi:phosphopantothenoylcysteine decarboxylase/phosphopantothenate--cysteine ligase